MNRRLEVQGSPRLRGVKRGRKPGSPRLLAYNLTGNMARPPAGLHISTFTDLGLVR